MPFPVNQVMNYFHVFIPLLTAFCLAAVHIMASHQEHLHHRFGLLGAVFFGHLSCVPQQLNSRWIGEFCVHGVESSLGLLVLSAVYSMILSPTHLLTRQKANT